MLTAHRSIHLYLDTWSLLYLDLATWTEPPGLGHLDLATWT